MVSLTPWQKVTAKLGLNASGLASKIGRHRSKLSRALKDKDGLISGRDLQLLQAVADGIGVELTLADITPDAR
jgi:hypothetical protein